MSQLSVLLVKIEGPIAQLVLASTLSGSIGNGILSYIESNPGVTEANVEAYVNDNIETYITEAIAKLPSFEQAIADIVITAGLPAFQSFINQQINKAYTWAVSQLAGKANGSEIIAALNSVPATGATVAPNTVAA